MSVRDLEELNVTVASSNFDSPQLGAARWFVFGTDQSIQSVCLYQGVTVYSDAYTIITQLAPDLRRQDGITELWRAPMQTIAASWTGGVEHPNIPGATSSLAEDSTIRRILARPINTWNESERRTITQFIVWFAYYSRAPAPLANAQIGVNQVTVPSDCIPLPMGTSNVGPPEAITGEASNHVPAMPVCYPPNSRLPQITDNPQAPFPQPLGPSVLENQGQISNEIPMEPAMAPGGDLGFSGLLAPVAAAKMKMKGKGKRK